MLILSSSKSRDFSLHFLPSFSFSSKANSGHAVTWSTSTNPTMSPSSSRQYSREGSYDFSAPSSQSPTPNLTIHTRRMLSRHNSSSISTNPSKTTTPAPLPPSLNGFADFFHSRVRNGNQISVPEQSESDEETWERMVALQAEYHCYRSARLEAAVERFGEVAMREFLPSSFILLECLCRG